MSDISDFKAFSLRSSIQSHATDIRCVSSLTNGFITGSRDKTCKAFLPIENSNTFREVQHFTGPENYVSSICCLNINCNQTNETLIYVGSNDAVIYVYDLQTSQPKFKLTEHSGTVCSLSADNKRGLISSGSWDQTCRLWSEQKCKAVFVGHKAAVWTTAFIGDHVITGSADKTLKLWKWETNVECIQTFNGHTDCIRGIAVISETNFLSCSNDASVREWNTNGETIAEYYGHENYIYSITSLSNGLEFATCGEDRTVRIWKKDHKNEIQTIRLPATTLWSLTTISNNDLVIGSSTGKVYILTRDESNFGSDEELKALEEELSKSTVHMSDIGEIKVNELPTVESLLIPGKRDGQTKLVKDGDKVSVHNWDANKFEWIKIGDVVGAAGATKDPSQKTTYNGKEYDYVFSIDIEEGVPPLKLPYNITDDPWNVAQQFIYDNNISQTYLEQIANFITKNSQGMQINSIAGNSDPFTGGNSYVPQTNGSINNQNQSNTYQYFPQKEFLKFEKVDINGISKKLKEFSELIPTEFRLNDSDIKMLLKLSDITQEVQSEQIFLIKLLLSWPKKYIFPALDLIRVSLLLPRINEELCASKDSIRLIDTLLVCGTDANSTPNQMVAFRAFSNLFIHPVGEALAITHSSTIFKALSKCLSSNKNVEIALSTIFLNFSVSFQKDMTLSSALKFELLTTIVNHLNSMTESESQFRNLVSLGTLAQNDQNICIILKSEEIFPIIKKLSNCSTPEKVGKCAKQILNRIK